MLEDQDLLALQEVRTKVEAAYRAFEAYRAFSQSQIDTIVDRMAAAGRAHARRLAELAVEETRYGNARDKLAKNLLAADLLARKLQGVKTVGILRECSEKKIVEIGVPMGVIAAILPTTNPTSTAIYKILIALKAGNSIVLSPHPRAKRCTCETAEILYQAARQAGAPENIIQCIDSATLATTNELMRHKRTAAILSTGGSGIVKAAYSSGKPAFGVGPGNVPVVIDVSADVDTSVAKVIQGKTFDYGTLCSSEQIIIAENSIRDKVIAALKKQKAHICDEPQKAALTRVLLVAPNWGVNPECVGQPAPKIAQMAGFEVPAETTVLAAEIAGIGKEHPLSAEKLSPVLALHFVPNFPAAVDAAEAVLRFHGLGHTCGIYSKNEEHTRQYALRMPAMRVVCNSPTPQGSTGITTNLQPAMTLGCGAIAGNITGDNIGPKHLINIKRLAYAVREASEAFEIPPEPPRAEPKVSRESQSMPKIQTPLKDQIAAAVERFLADRGALGSTSANTPVVADAASVVDRFLSNRQPATSSAVPQSCPAPRAEEPAPEQKPAPAVDPPAPAPPPAKKPAIVDFVSEYEVRLAIRKGEKIHIGPKTIVTPSAKDLASDHDTIVLVKPE